MDKKSWENKSNIINQLVVVVSTFRFLAPFKGFFIRANQGGFFIGNVFLYKSADQANIKN